MKFRLMIEVNSIETKEKIEAHFKRMAEGWIKDNFWDYENAKIKVEEVKLYE